MRTIAVLEMVVKGKRITEGSKRAYKYALESLAKFTEEWPEDIGVVNEWVAKLPKEWSDETVCKRFEMCMAAGNYMQKIMGRNPDGSFRFFNAFQDAEKPTIKRKQRRYFTSEEMVNCLKACNGEMELVLVSTLINSTCRIGELVGLRGRDVGDNFFVSKKGKTGQRHYRLNSRICQQLKKLAGSEDGIIFKKADGKSTAEVYTLADKVRAIIKRAGISGKKVGPHTFRHSGASLAARKTQSALVVKALLQHDKIDTSMLYIHDAEMEIQQSVYPLSVINIVPVEQETMLLTDGKSSTPEDDNVVEEVDLISDMFPMIPDGTEVRPLLKTRDLKMLREVFILYSSVNGGDNRVYEGQELLKRMLRKVK